MAGALRTILARFGITADTTQLDRADRRVSSTASSLRGLVAAAGGAATLRAMQRFVSESVAMGDRLDKTSQQLGLTTTELQSLSHAAELSGVDAAAFSVSIGQLQQKAVQATRGSSELARSFRDLGISTADLTGPDGQIRPAGELLRIMADGLQRTDNPAIRVAASMALMGEQGRRLLPMLTQGSAGLNAMGAELERLGGGASQEFIRQSVQLTDDLTRMRLAITSLRTTFLTGLLPTLTRVVQWLTRTAAALSRGGAAAAAVRPILVALGVAATAAGVAAASAWGAAIAPVLLAGAAAAILYLAFDDVATAVAGGDSMIGRFIDSLYGVGTTTELVQGLRLVWNDLVSAIMAAWEGVQGFGEAVADTWRLVTTGSAESADERHTRETSERQAAIWERARRRAAQAQAEGGQQPAQPAAQGRGARPGQRQPAQASERSAAGSAPRATRTQPAVTQNVTIGSSTSTINVHAAQDPQATARLVGREIDRREAARNRAVLAALEPARASEGT